MPKIGCGKPTHVAGTNGGTMPCGANLTMLGETKPYYCDDCQSYTLVELLNIASSGYEDDYLKTYYLEDTGEFDELGSGDTLAEFIVKELSETFSPDDAKALQLQQAISVMSSAERDIQRVIEVLEGTPCPRN